MSEGISITPCQKLGMVRCCRCLHWHDNLNNFGHEPEYLKELEDKFKTIKDSKELKEIHTKLEERLCDNCVEIILEFFPEHESVKWIKKFTPV